MNRQDSISALIFDLGGVIARIDFEKPLVGMGKFTDGKPIDRKTREALLPRILQYEKGQIDSDSFLGFLQEAVRRQNPVLPPSEPSFSELKEIWNSMITELPLAHLLLLEKVRTRYNCSLLSNTNDLHIRYVEHLQPAYPKPFSSLFHHIFLSHELHMSKPEPAIYRHLLQTLGIPAKECLFIDDRPENLEAARKEGIRTYHLTDFRLEALFTREGRLNAAALDCLS